MLASAMKVLSPALGIIMEQEEAGSKHTEGEESGEESGVEPTNNTKPGLHLCQDMLLLPETTEEILEDVKDIHFHPRDLLFAGYPGCGLSWLIKVVRHILLLDSTGEGDDFPEEAFDYIPYLERQCKRGVDTVEQYYNIEPPRLAKTHLPAKYFRRQLNLLKIRAIVMMRNPKDTLVSLHQFYRSSKTLGNVGIDWDTFFRLFQTKQMFHGDWFDHAQSWWEQRRNPNLVFVHYEDFHTDLRWIVQRLANFLFVKLKPNDVARICAECEHYCGIDEDIGTLTDGDYGDDDSDDEEGKNSDDRQFEVLQSSPSELGAGQRGSGTYYEQDRASSISLENSVEKFGGWKEIFIVDQNEYIDDLFCMKLSDSGLEFQFEPTDLEQ